MKQILLPLMLALPLAAHAQHSPYAGEQTRAVKALSETDVRDLLTGQGMGLAKAAELNGYPGPAHVLEHADALGLSAAQRQSTQALMERHKARAQQLGKSLLQAEERLDQAFARRTIDEGALSTLMGEIGQRQAELRREHLRTHLEQTALLSEQQVDRYQHLRGYQGTSAPAGHAPRHHGPAAPRP